MQLSKSDYMSFLRHPAWLWLKKHDKSKLPEVTEDTQATFDAGHDFEKYAEQLFPGGVTVGFSGFGEYATMPSRTKQVLDAGAKAIFQGRLEVDDMTCIFDVLTRNENGSYDLYEIKTSTSVKPEHEHDLAFQVQVLEKSGLTIESIYVIHVNNAYVRRGDIDYEEITDTTEVTSAVRALAEFTEGESQKAKDVMNSEKMPDPSPRFAGMGALGEWLEIYRCLNPKLAEYSIYDLYSPGATRIGHLEDSGIVRIQDIPEDSNLTVKQLHQVEATKRNERLINKEEIKEFLRSFQFPLYFLDYETLAGVVPAYDGLRPYQQVPFQYSLHKLASPDSELEHAQYLHTDNTLPVVQLAEQLKRDIGTEGSVVTWNQSFEKACNDTMGGLSPVHSVFLAELNDRIVDLMTPFAEGWYVDKDFFGSASIKAVLPVMVPRLSYKELNIHGGNAAQRIWMQTIPGGQHQDKKDEFMNDLRKYCTLDTLAMVEIWRILDDLVKK